MKPANVSYAHPRLAECQQLIKMHPLFSDLTNDQAWELASLCELTTFQAGDVIVKENDWVDAVYFIAEGQAEIKRQFTQLDALPVAILKKHEAIGLSETGFYSVTGRRFATVTAITSVLTFRLFIDRFNLFLILHPDMHQKIQNTSRVLSVTYFIQQAIPFLPASFEALYLIAKQIRETVVPANTYIFHQHQVADACYLLISGKMHVLVEDENGATVKIATLTPPTIFGEAALLTSAPRNASVLTVEPCHLLILQTALLIELVAHEPEAHAALQQLIQEREKARPIDKLFYPLQEDTLSLKGKYFHLTKEGWLICQ